MQRRNDENTLITIFGDVNYKRTFIKIKGMEVIRINQLKNSRYFTG
ncbi:MAG TPA: hypothetical protein VK071_09100 [Tissierellales bacterium]|nr:hypothetical protein [Tissierellales bacterium]